MAAPVVASSAQAENSGTTLTLTKPTGLALGERLVVGCHGRSAPAAPDGTWSTIIAATHAVGGDTVYTRFFEKIAESGDVAASNFVFTNVSGSGAGVICRVTGSHASNLADASGSRQANSTTGQIAAVTTTVAETLLLSYHSTYHENDVTSTPSGYTIVQDVFTRAIMWYDDAPSAGAISEPTYTTTLDEWTNIVAAIPPAGPAATLEQLSYRWRSDDGSETTATWLAAENTAP